MKGKALGRNSSPLSTFFRSSSDTATRTAYVAAAERAIESQRKVLEEAKTIRETQALARIIAEPARSRRSEAAFLWEKSMDPQSVRDA
ncbi:hypothetical protein ACPA1H_08670 [Ectopseudomonas chengduensis]|nr:hypothetical protein [Pseudomonas alcaliphila]